MTCRPDITLVHLQGPAPVVSPPLGCLCLLSALEHAGIAVDFRDYQLAEDEPFHPDGLMRFVTEEAAGIIGISAMVNVLPHLVRLIRQIRERAPMTRIVLGGPGPTSVAESLMRAYPFADAIVLGEAEETLPHVVRALMADQPLAGIPGLLLPTPGGVARTSSRPRIRDLDSLPAPAYDRIELARYNGALPLELSRGCPFSCAFCETSAFWGRQVRHYRPERVAGTAMRIAGTTGRDQFGFVDDTFGIDRARATRFLNLVGEAGITWTCSTRVERLDEAWVAALSSAGCTGVFLGVESGADRVLARIGKHGLPVAEIPDRVALLAGRFDPIIASFVWGYPWETVEEVADTLALAASLRGLGAATPLHLLSALPSAPLTREFAHLRRFDPGMMPDISAAPLDQETTGLVREDVAVFSSFYYFDHPAVHTKRALVRRRGGMRGATSRPPCRPGE